jgi:hypothetical protein
MSALEALVLAGKGLNAFSVIVIVICYCLKTKFCKPYIQVQGEEGEGDGEQSKSTEDPQPRMEAERADNSVWEKASKEDSKTASTNGASEQPPTQLILKFWVVLLEVQLGIVGPTVASSMSEASSQQQ